MRFVVVGAGAIGGAVGARLYQKGYDVTLVARGEHGAALASGARKSISQMLASNAPF